MILIFASLAAADDLKTLDFTIDGVARTALVHAPPDPSGSLPLVFVFHGHGGSSRNAERTFQIDKLWPAAISVYPQGLPTVGQLTDPQGKLPGWQSRLGNDGDRDLHFFDVLLTRLKKDYPVNPTRIYCTGHSNGGGFTYFLWRNRADVFAAVAVSSAAAAYAGELTPKPALILSGRSDPLVRFAWQELTINAIRKVNGCVADGQPWQGAATLFPSPSNTPLITFSHAGGHAMDSVEPGLIVHFFSQPIAATQP